MYSVTGDTTSLVPGFPIRTSSDPRSVDSSPRHNAASHVLHRLPVPRHPPCALKHLQHKTIKKFSEESEIAYLDTKNHHPPQRRRQPSSCVRCSQPLSTNQTPHPTTKAGQQQPTPTTSGRHPPRGGNLSPVSHTRDEEIAGLLSQSPIVCLAISFDRCFPTDQPFVVHQNPIHYRCGPSHDSPSAPNPHTMWAGLGLVVLLRKEVIQPHLPVRLPCYDFVPIADPTFDGSLPQGVRPPASGVTDFHDVTGGVYKARERIHRSVADLRLLATPTSRGRVADPDPN